MQFEMMMPCRICIKKIIGMFFFNAFTSLRDMIKSDQNGNGLLIYFDYISLSIFGLLEKIASPQCPRAKKKKNIDNFLQKKE